MLQNYSLIIGEAFGEGSRLLQGAAALAKGSSKTGALDLPALKLAIRKVAEETKSEYSFSCKAAQVVEDIKNP
jgi:hypothetical protein